MDSPLISVSINFIPSNRNLVLTLNDEKKQRKVPTVLYSYDAKTANIVNVNLLHGMSYVNVNLLSV